MSLIQCFHLPDVVIAITTQDVLGRWLCQPLRSLSLPQQVPWGTPLTFFPLSNPFKFRSEDCGSHETLGPGRRGAARALPRGPASQPRPCPSGAVSQRQQHRPHAEAAAAGSPVPYTATKTESLAFRPSESQKRVLTDDIVCSFNSVLEMCAHRGIAEI